MAKHTFWLRASSLKDLFDCAYRWEGIQVLGMRTPKNGKAVTGTALHAATCVFDKAEMKRRGSGDPAEAEAVFVDSLNRHPGDVVWEDGEREKCERVGRELVKKYIETIGRQRVFRAVEHTLKPLEVRIGDVVMRLTGTLDRLRREVGKDEDGLEVAEYGVGDVKSGENAVRADGTVPVAMHRPQIGVYEVLASREFDVPITLPAEVVGLQVNGKARVGTGIVEGAAELVVGTDGEKGLLEIAADMLSTGTLPGNPSSLMCHKNYCPRYETCRFRRGA